jgi:hypothetical protein
MTTMHCPRCQQATVFHVERKGQNLVLKCWYDHDCGWTQEIRTGRSSLRGQGSRV